MSADRRFLHERRRCLTVAEKKRNSIAARLRQCGLLRERERREEPDDLEWSDPWMWLSTPIRDALKAGGFNGMEDVQDGVEDAYFWYGWMSRPPGWTGVVRPGEWEEEIRLWTEFMFMEGDLVKPKGDRKPMPLWKWKEEAVKEAIQAAERISDEEAGDGPWLPVQCGHKGAIKSGVVARLVLNAMDADSDGEYSADEAVLFLCMLAAVWGSARWSYEIW
jgi:hypothetical protein